MEQLKIKLLNEAAIKNGGFQNIKPCYKNGRQLAYDECYMTFKDKLYLYFNVRCGNGYTTKVVTGEIK